MPGADGLDLRGKAALVLGGSRGIGAAIVRVLADAGADVAFTYRGSEDAARTLADAAPARAVRSDLGDRDDTRRTVAAMGPLDILVVSAGINDLTPAPDQDPDIADRILDVNVRGPFHAAAVAGQTMREDGRIVFIGSVHGDRMPVAGCTAYAMTKSAVQGLTRGLARDLGPRGITVNTVQPGPVDTEMNPEDGPMAEASHAMMAIKRHAAPGEVAALVAYLLRPEAAMITGAMLTIDGGMGV